MLLNKKYFSEIWSFSQAIYWKQKQNKREKKQNKLLLNKKSDPFHEPFIEKNKKQKTKQKSKTNCYVYWKKQKNNDNKTNCYSTRNTLAQSDPFHKPFIGKKTKKQTNKKKKQNKKLEQKPFSTRLFSTNKLSMKPDSFYKLFLY